MCLIHDNLRLIYHVCRKLGDANNVNPRELYSAGYFGLHAAAQRYDAARGAAFGTYAHHVIEGYVRVELKRATRRTRPVSFTDAKLPTYGRELGTHEHGFAAVDDADELANVERRAGLTPSQRDSWRLFLEGKTLKQVARTMGRDRTTVAYLRDAAVKKLRKAAGGLK